MTGTARVLLFSDPAMAGHHPPGHPERPERVEAVISGITDAASSTGASLERPRVEPAEAGALERIHPAPYLALLDDVAAHGGGWIDADTFIGPESMVAARLAAGAMVQAALAVAGREAEVAFAAVRPPGHHARRERAAGFCLLNNVALAARALRASGMAQRIAILDWDVHHGDGTQSIFDADPDLCYASTHQMPLYPGSGDRAERGVGPGLGSKHNVPLRPGSGDAAFIDAWLTQLLPAVEAFAPQAILVSAGYDAHRLDPLAELEVTEAGYRSVAEAVGRLARAGGVGGVALTLEGGYDLDALHDSAAATVGGLLAGLTGSEAA
ncbi:MAG: histone deacetylase [Chloroflexi bacterium]|nr:histone deacetylase [Chloroflexota bacterium]